MQIRFTKETLGNGLDVIVHEDRDLPIVAVNVWYHVGSKNERRGLTGFAHLFEHLMFEGSAHHDHGFFRPLEDAGASLNGSTSADRTNYWQVVPTSALELALWLESDRMGFLLPALTEKKFENQRSVVLNERRQSYENRPYGLAGFALLQSLYPPDHPYHWPTIGFVDDLRRATLSDAQAFFARYYHPANASIAIAGDIATGEALEHVERYFGDIPPGPSLTPPSWPFPAQPSQRLLLEDRVELPRLYYAWHSPALFAPDDAACDVLTDVLTGGKTSRLYRRLVHETRLAIDVSAGQSSRELSSFLQLVTTAAPGHSLSELERLITEELTTLATHGPTDAEMERGLAQTEAHFIYRLQTVGGFDGKSDQLNAYNIYLRNPGFFDEDLDRYRRVTKEDVRLAAERCLGPTLNLSVVPLGRLDLALADSTRVAVT